MTANKTTRTQHVYEALRSARRCRTILMEEVISKQEFLSDPTFKTVINAHLAVGHAIKALEQEHQTAVRAARTGGKQQ